MTPEPIDPPETKPSEIKTGQPTNWPTADEVAMWQAQNKEARDRKREKRASKGWHRRQDREQIRPN